ncbi:hypothetical protein KQ51_01219 [Candidatus Izimaplasma bacterium HR1]|jgi:uncharacterized membrane protein YdjX (TVP38/TMEM64 family)|uniref:hypothetical protein n=1 Tax=Candidatus Izimoplasma sp. HR1 TaxID=1541959 RepID=UPI0004F8E1AE|nr:hypothetical protein KQ51_01219 [Candidatus Izimaplasma bacterium HR1]
MDFNILFDQIMLFLGNYGFIIVIIFGLLHPIIDNPWAFFTMSLSFTLLGFQLGFLLLIVSNILGIIILFIFIKKIDNRTEHYLYKKKVSGYVLKWLESTPSWKHIIVIGLPLVPTFFLKIAFPFTTLSFKRYFITVLGAYMFLYSIYTLVYFGLLSFITDNIPEYVGILLIILFTVIVYFGKQLYIKLFGPRIQNEIVNEDLI